MADQSMSSSKHTAPADEGNERPAKNRRVDAEKDDSWTPTSWRSKPIKQQPDYLDKAVLKSAMEKLNQLPPLVQKSEVDDLKRQLTEVAAGKKFILQGGDCAERFQDCNSDRLQNKLKVLLQMSTVLLWGARIPLVRVGRIAGQYMKPRSKPTEVVNGKEMLAYKGDAINGFPEEERAHDPNRLVEGYFHSAATLNYCRGLLEGEFADLNDPSHWDLSFVKCVDAKKKYDEISKEIHQAMEFMNACGVRNDPHLSRVQLFTSHEGLVLDFEEAMTRKIGDKYYNLGAHLIWIGDRTRQLDGAHIEYFRGIQNPIGCKCGPTTIPAELIDLIQKINPNNDTGRIMLITRFGAGEVKKKLPEIIEAVEAAGLNVVWECDPMHGNTFSTDSGIKTREFSAILTELMETFEVHEECGTWLGGVHLELTGENVTECTGGASGLNEADLSENYESFCDPRLNWQQSIEMSFKMVQTLKRLRRTGTQRW
eukprot:m.253302 g.253302  ORF g.253302 m.253302 type:complete len:482 (-) comp33907_c4_seq1:32-1477(-)